ncbi:MAG: hypothetical protein ABIA93_07795 [Candidatus Woesearchaeota archaeon]
MKQIILLGIALLLITGVSAYTYQHSNCVTGCRQSIHTTIGDGPSYRVPYTAYELPAPSQYTPFGYLPQIPEYSVQAFMAQATQSEIQQFTRGYNLGWQTGDKLDSGVNDYEAMGLAYKYLQKASARDAQAYDYGFEAGYYDATTGKKAQFAQSSADSTNNALKQRNYEQGGIYWNMELWDSQYYIGPVTGNTPNSAFWGFRYTDGLVCNGKVCTKVNVFY